MASLFVGVGANIGRLCSKVICGGDKKGTSSAPSRTGEISTIPPLRPADTSPQEEA